MRHALRACGLLDLLVGLLVVSQPEAPFRWVGFSEPTYPALLQGFGLCVAALGFGCLLIARHAVRHWHLVLVVLATKVFVPIGFLNAALRGELPWEFGLVVLVDDVLFVVPLAMVLITARRQALAALAQPAAAVTQPEPVHRLQRILQTLSAPPSTQRRLFPQLQQNLERLRDEIERLQARPLEPGVAEPQRELIERVRKQLGEMPAGASLDGDEWARLRGAARQALVTFGWSVDIPLSALRRNS
jgi:hypothetical protein